MNAIYARVSDDKLQDDGSRRQDVMRQVDRLRPYAGPDAVIFLDDAKSAFREDYNSRPGFCRLLREVRANRIQRVYIESMDRWSRRVTEGLTTLKELGEHGCQAISIAEGELDVTSSQGWLKTGIFLLMAEWASRDKSEKIRHAMRRRAEDGRKVCHTCGKVHLGRHPLSCGCPACRKKGEVIKSGQNHVVNEVAGLG